MQQFRPPLFRKDTEEIIRESLGDLERLQRRQAEIQCVVAQSKARLADTREILTRMDAALSRLNIKL